MADRRYTVLDLRETLAFNAAHISASFGIAQGPKLSQWAAEVVPHDRPLLLVAPEPEGGLEEAVRALIRVGLDNVVGYLDGGMDAWLKAGLPTQRIDAISVPELHGRLEAGEDLAVLDVRSDAEWEGGHINGAVHVPLPRLPDDLDGLDRNGRLAVYCGSGYRSTVAASVLERAGFDRLLNVMGGITAWRRAGLETVKT